MSSLHSLYLTKRLLCKNCLKPDVNSSSGDVIELTVTFKNKYKLTFILSEQKFVKTFICHKIKLQNEVLKYTEHTVQTSVSHNVDPQMLGSTIKIYS